MHCMPMVLDTIALCTKCLPMMFDNSCMSLHALRAYDAGLQFCKLQ